MTIPPWLRIPAFLRTAIKPSPFWVAASLAALAHAGAFAAVLLILPLAAPHHATSLPVLVVTWGDSDREGVPVDVVAPNPGTLRPGAANTPGGDGAAKAPPKAESDSLSSSGPTAAEARRRSDGRQTILESDCRACSRCPSRSAGRANGSVVRRSRAALTSFRGRLPPAVGRRASSRASAWPMQPAGRPTLPRPLEEGLEGTPVIWLRVSADGEVLQARLQKSCGHPILDDAALRWAREQKFIPASRDGVRVEAEVTKPVHFYLN